MKAWRYERYGGPEVLRFEDVPEPVPGAGQVLIDVRATSVNSGDCRMISADPFLIRLMNGLLRPRRYPIPGVDVAGVVVAVGPGVSDFAAGDRVFGDAWGSGMGAFAERVAVDAVDLSRIPDGLSFAEAGSLPTAAFTAIESVRDFAELKAGQSVLIQGAGGGVGTALVQVAVAVGARVTAVCGPGSVELARELGAERVLDYRQQDFAAEPHRYDAVFAVNGHRPLGAYIKVSAPNGTYVMIGGSARQLFGAMLLGPLRFAVAGGGRRVRTVNLKKDRRRTNHEELLGMLAAGTFRPVIERSFPFEDARAAFEHAFAGHVRGKVVVERTP